MTRLLTSQFPMVHVQMSSWLAFKAAFPIPILLSQNWQYLTNLIFRKIHLCPIRMEVVSSLHRSYPADEISVCMQISFGPIQPIRLAFVKETSFLLLSTHPHHQIYLCCQISMFYRCCLLSKHLKGRFEGMCLHWWHHFVHRCINAK